MEGVTTFLESSTIHGLTYISTTRRLVRFLWIIIVIGGFTGAGFLIHKSFQDWSDNPITTTIDTRPIEELGFPKVTVCPPKDTYTDLNYDLIRLKNITLDNNKRNELKTFAKELLYDHLTEEKMRNMSTLLYKDRYYNWYHGYTQLQLPYIYNENCLGNNCKSGTHVFYYLGTSATSGTISTKYFGEKFDGDEIETNIVYSVKIYVPDTAKNNPNVSLNIELKHIPMTGLSTTKESIRVSADRTERNTRHLKKNYTKPSFSLYSINLRRHVNTLDVVNQNLDIMPGFTVTWYYTGMEAMEPYDKFIKEKYVKNTKPFIRLSNILKVTRLNVKEIWDAVKNVVLKVDWGTIGGGCLNDEIRMTQDVNRMVKMVEDEIKIKSSDLILGNMTKEDLEIAAEMFIYLINCPTGYQHTWFTSWSAFYNELFESQSLDRIILTINRIMNSKPMKIEAEKEIAQKLFMKIATFAELKYEGIHRMMPGDLRNITFMDNDIKLTLQGKYSLAVNFNNLIFTCMLSRPHPY